MVFLNVCNHWHGVSRQFSRGGLATEVLALLPSKVVKSGSLVAWLEEYTT